MDKELISIIIPCYNEEPVLSTLKEALLEVMNQMNHFHFEVLFINDGSSDKTLDILKSYHKEDSRMNYLSFSRNFGKEAAIYAGLQKSKGKYVALMDADMQDPPSLLPEMMNCLNTEDYDCVATRRSDRKGEPPIRSFFAKCFYKMINKMSDTNIVDGARDFRLMKRPMVDAILSMTEYNRFSKGIFGWVGFRTKWISYENIERAAGHTKWSFWKLFLYSLEGIIGFSTAPLALASFLGIFMCIVAFLFIAIIIIKTLVFGDPTSGWPSMVCIMLLIGGIQLFCMGIIGQYIAKTYLESKKRPIYILSENSLEE